MTPTDSSLTDRTFSDNVDALNEGRPDSVRRDEHEEIGHRESAYEGHDIDTVRLVVDQPVEDPVPFDHLKGLDHFAEHRSEMGTFKSTAEYAGLRVSVTDSRVTVQGSLATLTGGHNARPFDHGAVQPALADVARELGFTVPHFMTARVMRLDVGANVPFDGPVSEVTGALVSTDTARVVPRGKASTAVAYTHRELCVYDKRAERGKRGVDPTYGDGPLMRVELRYKKDVDRQLGRAVTARLLCAPSFFAELGRRLVEYCQDQPFRPTVGAVDPGAFRVPSDLRKAYAALGVEATGGHEAAVAAVRVAQDAGRLSAQRAHALRREIRALCAGAPNATESDVADRFRRAVRRAVCPR